MVLAVVLEKANAAREGPDAREVQLRRSSLPSGRTQSTGFAVTYGTTLSAAGSEKSDIHVPVSDYPWRGPRLLGGHETTSGGGEDVDITALRVIDLLGFYGMRYDGRDCTKLLQMQRAIFISSTCRTGNGMATTKSE
ncbi:hypothetical protein VTO42DRAFT_7020 [Malbranchea cinnamomea]